MADDITYTSTSPAGPPNATKQVTDEHVTRGHMPLVKLAYSADGDATPIAADANGLEMQGAGSAGTPAGGVVSVQGVGGGTTLPVTEASASAIKTAVELMDDAVKADDAGFTVGTDKVVMGGGVAVAHGSNPDAADAADAVASLHNRHRIPFVIGGHPNIKAATYITTAAGTDDNVLAAISTGTKYVVTRISVFLDEATTVGVAVRLGFGATTIPALGASQADAVDGIIVYHPGLVPGAGFQMGDGSGILAVGGDGEELRITNEVPTSGTLVVSVSYYTIES